MNGDMALFFGIMLGDGCLSQYNKGRARCVIVTCGYPSDREFFYGTVLPLANKLRNKPARWREVPSDGRLEINFCDKRLFSILKELGFPVGVKGRRLSIPTALYDNKFIKKIIAGLYATDGSFIVADNNGIDYPRIELHSISHGLLSQVQTKLQEQGVHANLNTINRTKWGIIYRLDINGKTNVSKFEKKIRLVNPKHKAKFDRFFRTAAK
jgi:hypothetical protein